MFYHRIILLGLIAALLGLWLCYCPSFAIWLRNGLDNQYSSKSLAPSIRADAIVILGGGPLPATSGDWLRDDARSKDTRLGVGLKLYRERRAPVILLSGGRYEAERMAKLLQGQGVQRSRILIEDQSESTHENAKYTSLILSRTHKSQILLVTSSIHMRRALASYRSEGIRSTPVPAPDTSQSFPQMTPSPWPRQEAFLLTKRCAREYLGMWIYRALGWA